LQSQSLFEMKNLALTLIILSLAVFAPTIAQNNGSSVATPSIEGWLTDLHEAYRISKKTKKPIMANFTGSDWCGWCKRLKGAVYTKPAFKEWAAKNVVLLEIDFPKRKKLPANIRQQNGQLQRIFGVRGYPTVWIFNAKKTKKSNEYTFEKLGQAGFPRAEQGKEAQKFIENANNILGK